MIRFKDSMDFERCIDISKSTNGKFINFTVYVPSKGVTGNTMQISLAAAKELAILLEEACKDV